MVSVPTAAFERLANRPPTPPKDHDNDIDEALRFLRVDYTLEDTSKDQEDSTISTPAHSSPSSSLDKENGSKEKSAKRVEFSPCVTAHRPTTSFGTPTKGNPLLKRLNSKKDVRPLKSILKSTPGQEASTPDSTASPAPDYFSISDPSTFPAMLDSVVKLLASASSTSRLDGYRTLNGALKAYDDLPNPDLLKARMTLLTQFIARDISSPPAKNDPIDANLTTQALKLATAIILIPALSGCFSDDFQALIIDRSIDVVAREDTSKILANHHLYLLALQTFSTKAMTPAKAELLIASLATIHTRISGNSVIGVRLATYRRLLEQAPSAMLARINDWLNHVFHGSLSDIRDIRIRAMETGLYAGLALGANPQATKAIVNLFDTSTNAAGTYGDYFTARLSDMIHNKELGAYVPQIWSMVIMFFRSKKSKVWRWTLFKRAWMHIIQECMNASDPAVRYQASLAWNRLIFVVYPDQETKTTMDTVVQMLKIPITSAFDKKDRGRQSKEAWRQAASNYCHLLHYSLRPSQSYEELDIYWDDYVHPILSNLLCSGLPKDAAFATCVLKALFNGTSKIWNANLANESSQMHPNQLSRLDPKWIRSRINKALALLEPYLNNVLSSPAGDINIDKTPWTEFLGAIAEAGSQEVRASMELREALAQLTNFFCGMWLDAERNFKEPSAGEWITRFGLLVQHAIEKVGALHFGEANLLHNAQECFEAAPTPSHRPSKHHRRLQSPIVVIFGMFSIPPVTVDANSDYFRVAKSLIHDVCQAKTSRKSRLQLLRQCSDVISPQATTTIQANLWAIVARELTFVLAYPDTDQTVQEPQRLGNQVRDAVHILAIGIDHCVVDSVFVPVWQELYDTARSQLKGEAGEGAVVLGLMEPIAEVLLKATESISKPTLIQLTYTLLGKGEWPKNRQQMDDGRKSLWNTSLISSRHSIFEPFVHVLKLIDTTLKLAYGTLDECAPSLSLLVESLDNFLKKCPGSQLHSVLRRMQEGLASFVGDKDRKITTLDDTLCVFSAQIISLWQIILQLLKALPTNQTLLKALDVLLAAGLNSSHRAIVNTTVTFWNETFGQLDSLAYPPSVELAIRRVRPLVELELPTFPESNQCPSPLGDFVDSQTVEESDEKATPRKIGDNTRSKSPFKITGSARLANGRDTPNHIRQRLRSKGSSTPIQAQLQGRAKLRHEDSQMQFVNVPSSSPAVVEEESQLLTEHQKEVNSRQRYETAQMYPDFSSSPAPKSSRGKSRMPRLDFSAQKPAVEDYTTPTLEEHGPMDDYLTSSPTPKAAEKARTGLRKSTLVSSLEKIQPSEDAVDSDVPSSPPEMAEDMEYENTPDVSRADAEVNFPGAEQHPANTVEEGRLPLQAPNAAVSSARLSTLAPETTVAPRELVEPSHLEKQPKVTERAPEVTDYELTGFDSNLEGTAIPSSLAQDSEVYVDAPTKIELGAESRDESSSPIRFTDSMMDLASAHEHLRGGGEEGTGSHIVDEGDTRAGNIEDSFPTSTPQPKNGQSTPVKMEAQFEDESQKVLHTVQTRSSKRKRAEIPASVTPTKRRKPNSPLKRMLSWVTGSQGHDEDDEMGDCIVVASQPEQSTVAESTEQPSAPASAPASVELSKTRRGRGRPRKSETPRMNTPARAARTRQETKRTSSVLSTGSDKSSAAGTPRPSKNRRVTRSQDTKTAQAAAAVKGPRTVKHTTAEVIIPASNENEEAGAHDSTDESTGDGADSQLLMEQEVASQRDRVIAKPKSIMEKLKSILSDCKTMVLGSQEYRELDDVLFEVRREVHEAASRGRE